MCSQNILEVFIKITEKEDEKTLLYENVCCLRKIIKEEMHKKTDWLISQ